MYSAKVATGKKVNGWLVGDIVPGSNCSVANVTCLECGHERKYSTSAIGKGVPCNACKRLEKIRERIGQEFGFLTVTDVRVNNTDNTQVLCVCKSLRWLPWGQLRYARSCGCQTSRTRHAKDITQAKALDNLILDNDTLIRRSTMKKITGAKVNIAGKTYATSTIKYLIANGKLPGRYILNSSPQKAVPVKRKAIVHKTAFLARESGKCHEGGLCRNYKECGDADFLCDCVGKEHEVCNWRDHSIARCCV